MPRLTPIHGIPASVIRAKEKTLCIADLHLGYEIELRNSGFNIPDQTDRILSTIVETDEGDHLVILGDLKHTIPYAKDHEVRGIRRFISRLSERFSTITLITGNHDGGIRESLPDNVSIKGAKGIIVGGIGLVHGHSWPSEEIMGAQHLLWAHIHPSVMMRDRLGSRSTIKCWLRGRVHPEAIADRYGTVRVRESIIMPAFNPLFIGTPVNEKPDKKLSPLLRSGFVDLTEQGVYALDGVDLGMVSDLMR